ncbi:uncharacterized protein VICG_01820 [Vittaforma corneae ATCC 50505]|uniref:Fork-head domain-containing protein n=1 Tax=Vittaforma corneae (strain ATCC 50505) TaxID=993615 RepID=L2GJW0_VITCO|nr:uncharacterized protein VICG_01820 [Vittaforma corneae ATCC 50505]ELA41121.1 hypothetical protein VICG_01820 [Vittaforma corneae ATCC 50505]
MTKKIRILKDTTYYSLIKEAIYSTGDRMATSSNIFSYLSTRHPLLFTSLNSKTWKGNIRHVLSKNPEFVKIKKKGNEKEHYWTHAPPEGIEECRINANDRLGIGLLGELPVNKVREKRRNIVPFKEQANESARENIDQAFADSLREMFVFENKQVFKQAFKEEDDGDWFWDFENSKKCKRVE